MKYRFDICKVKSPQHVPGTDGFLRIISYLNGTCYGLNFTDNSNVPTTSTCVVTGGAISHLYDHLTKLKEPNLESFAYGYTKSDDKVPYYECQTFSKQKVVSLWDQSNSKKFYKFSYQEALAIQQVFLPAAVSVTPAKMTTTDHEFMNKIVDLMAYIKKSDPDYFESLVKRINA